MWGVGQRRSHSVRRNLRRGVTRSPSEKRQDVHGYWVWFPAGNTASGKPLSTLPTPTGLSNFLLGPAEPT